MVILVKYDQKTQVIAEKDILKSLNHPFIIKLYNTLLSQPGCPKYISNNLLSESMFKLKLL